MFVLTLDQIGSRRSDDLLPALLTELRVRGPLAGRAPALPHGGHPPRTPAGLVLPLERTVGDEAQVVLDDPVLTLDLALHLLRIGGWSIGIGAGPVRLPLAESARASAGEAFIAAREAVEAAKSRSRTVPLAVRGVDAEAAADAEAVLSLIGAVIRRRSVAGWAVVDRVVQGERQQDVADALSITQQAVSARLAAGLWDEERAARPAAARLLGRVGGARQDG
ncbi:hypothetical protein [Cellulomonas sp. NPDC089187]|uniref:hypothetical protein n=1 Tax=Cellulomonas sp. NPDC089187 TaxID=3154970 RepID=UPI00341FE220